VGGGTNALRCTVCGVAVTVVALHGCRGRRLCTTCGIVVVVLVPHGCRIAAFVLCVVSWGPSLPRVWCRRCCPCAMWVLPSLCRVWYCGCGPCAACGSWSQSLCRMGVAVMVFVLRVVLQVPSVPRVWCRSHGPCAVWVLHRRLCTAYGVTSLPLCCVWCHGCRWCPACGVMVTIFAPRVVLRLLSSCCAWCMQL
jgi:hypothetical protein